MQIDNVFDRYFYLRCVAISKEHLQSYIWMVPSLFQDATCSDLGYCVSLKQALAVIPFFKAESQFHCSHSYSDRTRFVIKDILSNFLCFCRTEIVLRWYNNNFETSLISGMHILKEVCYTMTSFPTIHFFYEPLFHWSTWGDTLCQGHCVYFTTLAAAIHFKRRSVVYLGKIIVAL